MIGLSDDLQRDFKNVFSRLASGVCVIAFWRGARIHGFTATSVTSVSIEPAQLLFCLSQKSESHSCLLPGIDIGISILSAGQRELSDRFARTVATGAYDDIEISSRMKRVPLLEGAIGHITATVASMIPSGDHTIVLCNVASAQAANDEAPLLYCRRAYHSLVHSLQD